MKPSHHIALGVVATVAMAPALGPYSVAFGAASVLIDTDHYLDFIYRNGFKDFSVKRAIRYYDFLIPTVKSYPFLGLSVFHTVEALAVAYLLSVTTSHPFFWAVFWGMLFHLAADLVHEYRQGFFFKRALSLLEYAIRWNLMKKSGQEPDTPYRIALDSLYASQMPDKRAR